MGKRHTADTSLQKSEKLQVFDRKPELINFGGSGDSGSEGYSGRQNPCLMKKLRTCNSQNATNHIT